MTITDVRIYPVEQEKLKAYVSIVLDDCFLVSDIKVISGPSGLFISMPSKRKKTGEFKDVAHPLNSETRQWMSDQILAEYHRALQAKAASPAAQDPPAPDDEPDHAPEEQKAS